MGAIDTRQRILNVAERHYAERGFAGMSMRALTNEAGVNLAAVNYHFGSKKELVHAILHERILPLNAECMEMLRKAQEEAGEAPIPLEVIMDALLLPVVRRANGPGGAHLHFLRMIGRSLSEDADEEFHVTSNALKAAIKRSLPELSDEAIAVRFHFCVGTMLGVLVKQRQFMKEVSACSYCRDIPGLFTRLRDFLCAGFRATQTLVKSRTDGT